MKSIILSCIFTLFSTALAYSSAEVTIDPVNKVIIISSHLVFYGSDANLEISEAASNEIQRVWNEPNAVIIYKGESFRLNFLITSEVVSYERLADMTRNNRSAKVNFIGVTRVQTASGFSLGGNSGFFLLADNIGTSTTAAHEYGHGLGLSHPDRYDVRGTGRPRMMQPNGSWVDHEFQIDPNAKAGTFSGVIDTSKRKVLQDDLIELEQRLNYISFQVGKGSLGKANNIVFNL